MYTISCIYVHYMMYICMCIWYTVYNIYILILILTYCIHVMYIVIDNICILYKYIKIYIVYTDTMQ